MNTHLYTIEVRVESLNPLTPSEIAGYDELVKYGARLIRGQMAYEIVRHTVLACAYSHGMFVGHRDLMGFARFPDKPAIPFAQSEFARTTG